MPLSQMRHWHQRMVEVFQWLFHLLSGGRALVKILSRYLSAKVLKLVRWTHSPRVRHGKSGDTRDPWITRELPTWHRVAERGHYHLSSW
ncbi:hypothetical protein EVAR_34260_1 [Eumeta japonica]|uniref:Uncharacterized protein n=1 Tax=Eumeta variegata TaxID=151549 RepID=A0A4C1VZJ2_EUMVA|nr:hypothetical protein EVAR_34260_1 [Eumeta japonica]